MPEPTQLRAKVPTETPTGRPVKPVSRSLHCPWPACGGQIMGTVPRRAHGVINLPCDKCGRWSAIVILFVEEPDAA